MVAYTEHADERARLLPETDGAADLIAGFAPTYNAGVDDVWAHPPREPRFDVRRVVLGLQPPPLWWAYPHIWRRRGWVFESIPPDGKTGGSASVMPNVPDFPRSPGYFYDRRKRRECIANLRRQERQAATATAFPSQIVLTREMFIAELELAYALLWRWPDGGNETETGVLDYTILRLLDWTPDATPATALAKAFDAAGWSRARYARPFEDRQHFVNWLRKETRFYTKSLGRCRTMIPSMHDDLPVQFKDGKVAMLGAKVKSAALVVFKGERHLTEPTIDIWDAIAEVRPCDDGERYDGLPSRATGRAARRGRRRKPGEVTRVAGGDVAGRQTLAERYGENIPQRQLRMVDRALDDMEQERQRDAEIPRKFAGRYNDNVPGGFARDDISDTSGAAPRAASGTRRARGAAAAQAVVERVHHDISVREWLGTLDEKDETLALIRNHWGVGELHEDIAKAINWDPEVVRAQLALVFEGLREAIRYEPSSRRKVDEGIKKLPIRSDTLDAIAAEMALESEIMVPSPLGGRPRKLKPQYAATRMSRAAEMLHLIESDATLFLVLEGVVAGKPKPTAGYYDVGSWLGAIVKQLAVLASRASSGYKPGLQEIVDIMAATDMLDEACRLRLGPGNAARFAVTLAFWADPMKEEGDLDGLDWSGLDRLLQEYADRKPRPPALAKPVSAPERERPLAEEVALRRHAADVRAEFRCALRRNRSFEISG